MGRESAAAAKVIRCSNLHPLGPQKRVSILIEWFEILFTLKGTIRHPMHNMERITFFGIDFFDILVAVFVL
jgi:hypothetical protein